MQRVACVQWSPDSKFVFSASEEMNIRIWKANASEKLGIVIILYFSSISLCLVDRHITSFLLAETKRKGSLQLFRSTEGEICQSSTNQEDCQTQTRPSPHLHSSRRKQNNSGLPEEKVRFSSFCSFAFDTSIIYAIIFSLL